MSNKEIEDYVRKIDEGLAMAEQVMLRDKAAHNETVVYSDDNGNIKYCLASDVLLGKVN